MDDKMKSMRKNHVLDLVNLCLGVTLLGIDGYSKLNARLVVSLIDV